MKFSLPSALALAVSMTVGLAACGDSGSNTETPAATTTTTEPAATTTTTTEPAATTPVEPAPAAPPAP